MDNNKIVIGTFAGGIGDYLSFTAIFKVLKNCEMRLFDHPKAKANSRLFDGLCDVSFTDDKNLLICPESDHPNQAQKKIEGLGISHLTNCIPQIQLTEQEKRWADQCITPYGDCVAFVADTAGGYNKNDSQARYRMYDDWEPILTEYQKRYTVLQFGLSNKMTKFNHVDYVIEDLNVRELAASYWKIGRYLGVNTGDYHLALSVGAKANVLVPSPSYFYMFEQWEYQDILWKNEKVRVKYVLFEDAKGIIDYKNFNY